MSVSLTLQDKRLLKRLLRAGRWGSESEIISAAIHLLAKHVEAEMKENWPVLISDAEMASIWRPQTREVSKTLRQLSTASCRIKPGDEE